MGFKFLPDNFGGFGLFKNTGKTLKPSLEALSPFHVGPIESVPQELQNEMSDLSVMRGELERDEPVLLGTIRFANHSCSPNTILLWDKQALSSPTIDAFFSKLSNL